MPDDDAADKPVPQTDANPPQQPISDVTSPISPDAETVAEPVASAPPAIEHQVVVGGKKSYKKLALQLVLLLVLMAGVAVAAYQLGQHKVTPQPTTTSTTKKQAVTKQADGLVLDTSKDYGNKYANGLLPVGDNKYETAGAKQGYGYVCDGYARNLDQKGSGAMVRGPWFTNNNTQYDVNKKPHVQGSVMWTAEFTNTVSGSTRTITTNDLPSHPTGVFPIATTDPAYAYDRNPNSIKGQTLTFALADNPSYGSPNCIGGQVGVMLTGVALFSGFDATGRDAGAWEVQDSCSGHPEKEGEYHYHTLRSCIKDSSVHTVIGYALDGFPITGPTVAPNNILTTNDLDECHGITSSYTVDGKTVTGYHYVMTQDFPYSVSCFRAQPIQPPGQPG